MDAMPYDIVIDRCYIHGDHQYYCRRGVVMNGRHLAVIGSYIADIQSDDDAQAIVAWDAIGPLRISNNFLSATGENINLGGALPVMNGTVASDITIDGNHFFKPMYWKTDDPSFKAPRWCVKNLFEVKAARRVLFENNSLENNWGDCQMGFAVQLTVRTEAGAAPWNTIEDLIFRRNWLRKSGAGFNIFGLDDGRNIGEKIARVLIEDNVIETLGPEWGNYGTPFQLINRPQEVTIRHNTLVKTGNSIMVMDTQMPVQGFDFSDNIVPNNTYGFFCGGIYTADEALNKCAPNATVKGNVVMGTGLQAVYQKMPGVSLVSGPESVGFTDYDGGDYGLSTTSLFRSKGSDGKDVGADSKNVRIARQAAELGTNKSQVAVKTVQIVSATPVTLTLSGAGCTSGTVQAPTTLSISTNASCMVEAQSAADTGGVRFVFEKWNDGVLTARRQVAPDVPVLEVKFVQEYLVTARVVGSGTIGVGDAWYRPTMTVKMTATPASGQRFTGWTGSVSGQTNPLDVVVDGPKAIIANFAVATQTTKTVQIVSATPVTLTLSGAGCSSGTVQAPTTLSITANASCMVEAQSAADTGGVRFVFEKWNDGVLTARRQVPPDVPVLEVKFIQEYLVTARVVGSGTIGVGDAWYRPTMTVKMTATPASGQRFTGWTGSVSGQTNPLDVVVDGPKAIVANFAVATQGQAENSEVSQLMPRSGLGKDGTFEASFLTGDGNNSLYLGYLLFLPTPNTVGFNAQGSCLIEYNNISKGIRLINDVGLDWLGPVSGVPIGSTVTRSLSNRVCTVDIEKTKVSASGKQVKLTFPVLFSHLMVRVVGTFLQTCDIQGRWTGMDQIGNWIVPEAQPKSRAVDWRYQLRNKWPNLDIYCPCPTQRRRECPQHDHLADRF